MYWYFFFFTYTIKNILQWWINDFKKIAVHLKIIFKYITVIRTLSAKSNIRNPVVDLEGFSGVFGNVVHVGFNVFNFFCLYNIIYSHCLDLHRSIPSRPASDYCHLLSLLAPRSKPFLYLPTYRLFRAQYLLFLTHNFKHVPFNWDLIMIRRSVQFKIIIIIIPTSVVRGITEVLNFHEAYMNQYDIDRPN